MQTPLRLSDPLRENPLRRIFDAAKCRFLDSLRSLGMTQGGYARSERCSDAPAHPRTRAPLSARAPASLQALAHTLGTPVHLPIDDLHVP